MLATACKTLLYTRVLQQQGFVQLEVLQSLSSRGYLAHSRALHQCPEGFPVVVQLVPVILIKVSHSAAAHCKATETFPDATLPPCASFQGEGLPLQKCHYEDHSARQAWAHGHDKPDQLFSLKNVPHSRCEREEMTFTQGTEKLSPWSGQARS